MGKKLFYNIVIVTLVIFCTPGITAQNLSGHYSFNHFSKIANSNDSSTMPEYRSAGSDITTLTGSIGKVLSSPFHWESNDFYYAGGFLLMSAGSFLLDDEIRKIFLNNRNKTFDNLEPVGYAYGAPLNAASGAILIYLSGLASDNNWLRNTGLMLTETIIAVGIVQIPTRIIFGRARPYTGYGNSSFNFLKGLEQDRASFISGHAAIAFGISNILAHQIDHPVVTAGLYGLAALTPLARLYADKHWTSDVFIGTALGILVSNTIINFHEETAASKNKFSIIPAINGISFCYTID